MTSASVADSAEVEVYASWALILVRMVCPSVEGKSLYHRSKQDKSRPNRTRVYSFGSVVHESIAKREAKGGLVRHYASNSREQLLLRGTGDGRMSRWLIRSIESSGH
jgi:hypothetical protein